MRRDDDRVLIYDIQRAIERVIHYTTGGRNEFFSNPMVQDAVIRNLEIIGEASKSSRTRRKHWLRISIAVGLSGSATS